MACSDGKPKREFKSTALKKLNDMFQGFVDLLKEEISFNSVLDAVVVNRDHKRELTYRLKIVENLVKSIREQVPDIQESLTVCDEILGLACGNSASLGAHRTGLIANVDVGVGGASNRNKKSEAVNERRTHPRRRGNNCRHCCSHHQEVMDTTLWKKLPREVVQHICAFLPLSKTLQLQKICKPWSRMPMATNFRQSCAKAHEDLFGVLMSHDGYGLSRIAISDSKHTEWLHLELNDLPSDRFGWTDTHKELFAHDGGLVCILPSAFQCFKWSQEPPSIFVFNPLTGDKRDIPLSSFTSSKNKNDTEAILLQLIVDSKTGCYELILVTLSGRVCGGGPEVYCSEKYDSKSKLWSTLDSGFVFGDGAIDNERCEVYFDCCSKQLCKYDGQPFEARELMSILHFGGLMSNSGHLTFVKADRFEIDFIDHFSDYRDHRLLQMSESVWENGWITRSTTSFPMEEPPNDLKTRLFACQRYLLVVADDAPSDVFEHRHQRMLLFDRKTRQAAYDIPDFWRAYDFGREYMDRNLYAMCDLNWNVVP